MKNILKIKYWTLYLAVFTLPMYMGLNNLFLGLFIFLGVLELFITEKTFSWRIILKGWPILIFFWLALMGSFFEFEFKNGFKELERYWSLLFIPLLLISDEEFYVKQKNQLFLSLIFGCIATLFICYGNLIYEMIFFNEPLNYFFRWRHIGHQFTEVADTHPTYLGLFVFVSIVFLIRDKIVGFNLRIVLILFLIIGLFQLASRMSLLLLIIFLVSQSIYSLRNNRIALTTVFIGLIVSLILFNSFGSNYIKDRMFSKEAFIKDKRIQRWEASYEIFKENPFIGVGFAKIESVRNEKYQKFGFTEAARNDLNAHNQFLEFLSRNGVLGGFFYVISLTYLLLLSIYSKDYLFSLIFISFILSNLTESMLVRIRGIEYFVIFTSLFLAKNFNKRPNEYLHNT